MAFGLLMTGGKVPSGQIPANCPYFNGIAPITYHYCYLLLPTRGPRRQPDSAPPLCRCRNKSPISEACALTPATSQSRIPISQIPLPISSGYSWDDSPVANCQSRPRSVRTRLFLRTGEGAVCWFRGVTQQLLCTTTGLQFPFLKHASSDLCQLHPLA